MSRSLRLGVSFSTRKRKKKNNRSDDDDDHVSRLHKCSSPIKRKEQQQQQQEINNKFGTNIYQCCGLNHRDVNYNYQDSYSFILQTWSQQLRSWGNRNKVDLIKEKKRKLTAKRGFEGSVRINKGRLKVGDRVNLSQILFTKHRDFLITYKDRDRPVRAEHLKDTFFIQKDGHKVKLSQLRFSSRSAGDVILARKICCGVECSLVGSLMLLTETWRSPDIVGNRPK
ncbi:hypothetical protein POM88_016604 [Heracleum sosnowskyi]|uniref:Uncharacterized protein n=1 Tax=Heracleum sosnowskyi TaxID=360622 RepID=A0AAD8MX28_9APIA|nr:hypothetical protein POM88_016604 [Heracleum sosnowskyi]